MNCFLLENAFMYVALISMHIFDCPLNSQREKHATMRHVYEKWLKLTGTRPGASEFGVSCQKCQYTNTPMCVRSFKKFAWGYTLIMKGREEGRFKG